VSPRHQHFAMLADRGSEVAVLALDVHAIDVQLSSQWLRWMTRSPTPDSAPTVLGVEKEGVMIANSTPVANAGLAAIAGVL